MLYFLGCAADDPLSQKLEGLGNVNNKISHSLYLGYRVEIIYTATVVSLAALDTLYLLLTNVVAKLVNLYLTVGSKTQTYLNVVLVAEVLYHHLVGTI